LKPLLLKVAQGHSKKLSIFNPCDTLRLAESLRCALS
jgi:hypothetical protein